MPEDYSLNPFAAYGSEKWCAQRLGKSLDWFRRARAELEAEGFPHRDKLIGMTHKADVETWLSRRRVLADDAEAHTTGHHRTIIGENHDAL